MQFWNTYDVGWIGWVVAEANSNGKLLEKARAKGD